MAEERARDRGFYFFGLRNGVCVWACGCSNLPWGRSLNFQITTIIIRSQRYSLKLFFKKKYLKLNEHTCINK